MCDQHTLQRLVRRALGVVLACATMATPVCAETILERIEGEVTAGRFDAAEALIASALPAARGVLALELGVEKANLLRRRGRMTEATTALDALLPDLAAGGPAATVVHARALRVRARIAIENQDPADDARATPLLKQAIALSDASGRDAAGRDAAHFTLAGLLVQDDDILGGYAAYSDVLSSAASRGDVELEARSLSALGRCLMAAGRADLAVDLLERAVRLLESQGAPVAVVHARARLAGALSQNGRAAEARHALKIASSAGVDLGRNEWWQLTAQRIRVELDHGAPAAALEIARSAWKNPLLAEAAGPQMEAGLFLVEATVDLGRFREARRLLDALPAPANASHRHQQQFLSARIHDALGARGPARAAYADAIALHASAWREASVGLLAHFNDMAAVQTPARRLIELYLADGQSAAALALVEQVRARATTIAVAELARRVTTVTARTPAAAETAGATHLAHLARLEQLMARVEPRRTGPAVEPAPLHMPAGTAALVMYESGAHVHLFWVDGQSVRHAVSPLDVVQLRQVTAQLTASMQRLSSGWTGPADRLGGALFGPFKAELAALRAADGSLAIIPHGFLHGVPFAATRLDAVPLLDHIAAFEAPSVALARAALTAPVVRPGPTLIVAAGDATHGPLPGARREAAALGASLPAQVLEADAATVPAFLKAVPGAGRIHLAVHGFRARDGQPGYLQLSPDAAVRADGRLDALTVLGLDLRGVEVFLSACETALGERSVGDEYLTVLDRAFLIAGARTVVSTKWAIDDDATRMLASAYYGALSEKGPLRALIAAQKVLRDSDVDGPLALRGTRGLRAVPGGVATRRSHPYYWSGFKLMGAIR
jgi:CHAT domain-containing protein